MVIRGSSTAKLGWNHSAESQAGTNGQSGQTGAVQISNGDLVTATFRKEEEAEIDHSGASRHHGQLWVSLSDMQPGVYAGERVQFRLYTERKGLGGEDWSEGTRACREIPQRNIV